MTFAQRVINLEPEGAYAVLARAQALEAQGREIIHMEIGQPDFQTYPNISLAGVKAIAEGYTRYNPAAGYPQLRQVIARDASARRGIEIRPTQVVVGPGGKPGLFFTAMALIEPGAGDEVLYPNPGYSTHWAMIDISGGKAVPVPLVEEKGFSFDLEAFDALVNERTKIVVINSPANPTGGVIPLKDLEHIAAAAHKYDFWVISDEIYSRLVFDGQQAPSIATLPGMQERTIIVDGFSKTYAMTGWRLGYAIMPEALASRVELLLNHAIGCTASFTQMAGIEALTGPQDAVDHVLAAYQARRDRIVAGLNAIPGVSCQTPQGAFYAFPNVKSFGLPSKQLADRILDEAGVSLLSGTDFGKYGEGYLRLSFATSMEVINQGLERLADFCARL
ncbi:MAG: pyridoxal phosphate-dependent aminotransferase [Anaerolineales bacterium]|nr:pyridoxal phosphate-dependent aminotransferase [Anaerolineales bacterium]